MSRLSASLAGLPIHPLLAAAYPVLFLFAQNAVDQVTLDPLWLPLGMALAGALVALGLVLAVRRDARRAALVTTVLVAAFFGYGHVWNLVEEWVPSQWLLVGAWLALAVVGVVVAWRAGGWAPRATAVLNVLGAILVGVNVVAIGAFAIGPQLASGLGSAAAALDGEQPERRPDVYYLVFDRYAGADVLRDLYGHDNEPFLSALEERGFHVATDSHANYFKTPLSLVSSLSMEYLDAEELRAEAEDPGDMEPIHRRLRGSLLVPAALKYHGYTYHHVANWWEPTTTNEDADVVYQDEGPTEFATVLVQTTLLRAVSEIEQIEPFDWRIYRGHDEYQLEVLEHIASQPSPKYVFAHLLLPHEPYVFDTDGSFMTEAQVEAQGERESYRRQLIYLNGRILRIVDRILAESDEPPIIVIQADEGPFPPRYREHELSFNWHGATDEELEEKSSILNAILLPGVDAEAVGLHRSSTPVNTFRVIFSAYFGADLPLLDDRVYAHVSQDDYYGFFEITDRVVQD